MSELPSAILVGDMKDHITAILLGADAEPVLGWVTVGGRSATKICGKTPALAFVLQVGTIDCLG